MAAIFSCNVFYHSLLIGLKDLCGYLNKDDAHQTNNPKCNNTAGHKPGPEIFSTRTE